MRSRPSKLFGRVAIDAEVTFGYEGTNCAFELCADHLEEFNNVMQGYIASARRVEGQRRSRPSGANREDPGAIREWARGAGYEVSDRGRIPAEIRDAYDAAHRGARK